MSAGCRHDAPGQPLPRPRRHHGRLLQYRAGPRGRDGARRRDRDDGIRQAGPEHRRWEAWRRCLQWAMMCDSSYVCN